MRREPGLSERSSGSWWTPKGMGKLRLRWKLVGRQGVCPASTYSIDERSWGVLLFPSSGARNHNCDLDLAKD